MVTGNLGGGARSHRCEILTILLRNGAQSPAAPLHTFRTRVLVGNYRPCPNPPTGPLRRTILMTPFCLRLTATVLAAALLSACGTVYRKPYNMADARSKPAAVPSRQPGYVISPFSNQPVDVAQVPRASIVRDPTTNREFFYTGESFADYQRRNQHPSASSDDNTWMWVLAAGAAAAWALSGSSTDSDTAQSATSSADFSWLRDRRRQNEDAIEQGKPEPWPGVH